MTARPSLGRIGCATVLAVILAVGGSATAATKKAPAKKPKATTTVATTSPPATSPPATAPPATNAAPTTAAALPKLTEPFKILVISPETSPATNLPELQIGARTGAKVVNDKGGVRGAKVEITWCDEKGDANEAAACARKAADGSFSAILMGGRVITAAYAAAKDVKAPIWEPTQTGVTAMKDERLMFFDGSTVGAFATQCGALAKAGAKKIVIGRPAVDAAAPIAGYARQGAVANGATVIANDITWPPVLTDGGPTAGLIRASGADGVCLINNAQSTPLILTALQQQGIDIQVALSTQALSAADIGRLGNLLDGAIGADITPPLVLENIPPGIDKYVADVRSAGFEPKEALASGGVRYWAAVQVLATVGATLPKPDGPSMLAALNAATDIEVPVFGKWSPGKKGGPGFERIPAMRAYAFKYRGNRPTLIQPGPYDLTGQIKQ